MIACESRPITATPAPRPKPAVNSGINMPKKEPKTMKRTIAAARNPNAVPLTLGCSV